jgi:plastocyanin
MGKHIVTLFALAGLAISSAPAATVFGEVKVDGRFNKKSLAPAPYDLRGMEPQKKDAAPSRRDSFERVAVWLESECPVPVPVKAVSPASAIIQQRNRHFEPALLIVTPGTKVAFPNLDPVFHNIFSFSPTLPFDLGYYAEGKTREVVFSRPGVAQVYCHVHPEMFGVVVVTASPWTAKPSSDGTFSFADVPPGKYKAVLWQRAAGLVHKTIIIPPAGDARVSFVVPEDQDK